MQLPVPLTLPDDVMEIARTLETAGFEAWCVGGALRDTLLAQPNSDHDIATSARPEEVQRLFKHTVPVGERFGTVAVRTRQKYHEVTTFRRDVTTDGRHAVVEFGVSLEDDLARRDFTINALAYHPLKEVWRDPHHGADDLDRRLVRAVGEAERRFHEDYLRILRAVRFAARFEFEIEPGTWSAACGAADGLKQLSAERVREEWFRSLRTARSLERLVAMWWAVGAAQAWIPELIRAEEPSNQGGPRSALAALRGGLVSLPRDPVLLTALLCVNPVAVLSRLKASRAEIARAAAIVTGPSEPESQTPVAVRRWLSAVGEAADDLSTLWELRQGIPAVWAPIMRGIRERGEPLTRKDLAITGADLQAAGLPPGPRMGTVIDQLLMEVVDDPGLNTREALLARARQMM